jgi:hypothetical protein
MTLGRDGVVARGTPSREVAAHRPDQPTRVFQCCHPPTKHPLPILSPILNPPITLTPPPTLCRGRLATSILWSLPEISKHEALSTPRTLRTAARHQHIRIPIPQVPMTCFCPWPPCPDRKGCHEQEANVGFRTSRIHHGRRGGFLQAPIP